MRGYYSKLHCKVYKEDVVYSHFALSSQVVLSSDPTFVPQFSWFDSHGLCSLASGPNTDILHLCGSQRTCMITCVLFRAAKI